MLLLIIKHALNSILCPRTNILLTNNTAASRVFLGVDAQLLWTGLVGVRMSLSICIKSSLKLNVRSLASPCRAPC